MEQDAILTAKDLERLASYMRRYRVSQVELSRRLAKIGIKFTQSALSLVLSGKMGTDRLTRSMVAEALGTTAEKLFAPVAKTATRELEVSAELFYHATATRRRRQVDANTGCVTQSQLPEDVKMMKAAKRLTDAMNNTLKLPVTKVGDWIGIYAAVRFAMASPDFPMLLKAYAGTPVALLEESWARAHEDDRKYVAGSMSAKLKTARPDANRAEIFSEIDKRSASARKMLDELIAKISMKDHSNAE